MNSTTRMTIVGVLSLVLVCAVLQSSTAFAQATLQPGPQPANFKLANNGSAINEYTGSLNWNYELLTVPGRGGLEFPLTLTYNGGIGCEQAASWVGLGFGLNLGSIDRSIIYIPDDMFLNHVAGDTVYHEHDGYLFDDNYTDQYDSLLADGPDMWTVAVAELGSRLSIVADSSNIFLSGNTPYGPAGHIYRAAAAYPQGAPWLSEYQRSMGLAVRIGPQNYEPGDSSQVNLDFGKHCYVSPVLGTVLEGRDYTYSGEIKLAFNDWDFSDNSGQCSVYVYKLTPGSIEWQTYGPFSVQGSYGNWTETGVTVALGDRFALYTRTHRFEVSNWAPVRIDYDVGFTNWDGYYVNPEGYSNPFFVWNDGYTPRIEAFHLATDEGTRYDFGIFDYVKATTFENRNDAEDNMSVACATSFKLTEIHSHDYVDADSNGVADDADYGNWVRIDYESTPIEIDYANKHLIAFDAQFSLVPPTISAANFLVWQRNFIHYPTQIETPTHRLHIYLSGRDDHLGVYGATSLPGMRPKKLDSLVLLAKLPDSTTTRVRSITFQYAPVGTKPTSFGNWVDGEPLGWHTYSYKPLGGGNDSRDSTGKLTLLSVRESGAHGDSLPALRFHYVTNPHYDETVWYSNHSNECVDYQDQEGGGGGESYYSSAYDEDWGYYRRSLIAKPGLDQRAWSLDELIYPTGARESIEWESNRYKWTFEDRDLPGAMSRIGYHPLEGPPAPDGAERGGVRLARWRLDGGDGSDSALIYGYGDGVATKPQSPVKQAFYAGRIGNAQEIGYRSVDVRVAGDSVAQVTQTFFTNASAPEDPGYVNYYRPCFPPVTPEESYRDKTVGEYCLLEGVKRGHPYRRVLRAADGDTVLIEENEYSFEEQASLVIEMPNNQNARYTFLPDIKSRSIRVRQAEQRRWQFDEDAANSVLFTTSFVYDSVNGRVREQADSIGNARSRIRVIEYLRPSDLDLQEDILTQKNLLALVRSEAVFDSDTDSTASALTEYAYSHFGEGRIYPISRTDCRTITDGPGPVPATSEPFCDDGVTTRFLSYDNYGNLLLESDPAGTKTSYNYANAGTQMVLSAPNSDSGEVTYNGFEDSIAFDGWNKQSAVQSPELSYSGRYSAKVVNPATYGPSKVIPDSLLEDNRYYVFSAWVYTTNWAALLIDLQGIGGAPDTSVSATVTNQWHRLEIVFQYSDSATGLECYCSGETTVYWDNMRIHPADSPMQTYAYDHVTGQLQAAFDANNVAWERYYYDGFGRLSTILDPDGDTTARFEYYYSRSESEDFDPENPNYVKETRFRSASDSSVVVTFYDGLGREIQRQTAVDATQRIVEGRFYNYAGQLAAVTKPIQIEGSPGSMAFVTDLVPSGWAVGEALTSGQLQEYYDADGPGPNCHGYPYTQTKYSDDPLRRIKEIGFPDVTWKVGSGKSRRYEYLTNADGDVPGWDAGTLIKTKQIDENGLVSYEYRDRLDRLIQTQVDSVDSDVRRFKTAFQYDVAGNLTRSVRQRSASDFDTTTFTYDGLSQLLEKTSADGGRVRYLYDPDGNLRFVEDAERAALDEFIYYKYDPLGRMIEEGVADDLLGTRFSQTNANIRAFPTTDYEARFYYAYDSASVPYGRGRLASWHKYDGGTSRYLQYSMDGQVIFDSMVAGLQWGKLQYAFDWQGQRVGEIDYTLGIVPEAITLYSYDMANRLSGVGNGSNSQRYAGLEYWPDGTLRTQTFRANDADTTTCQRLDYSYNPRGWLLKINDPDSLAAGSTGNGDHFALTLAYGTSFNGNVDSIGNYRSGGLSYNEIMTYDRLGRIARWHMAEAGADTSGDWVYSYDRAGNFLTWKKHDSQDEFWQTYHRGTNQLKKIGTGSTDTLTDYQWDENGNLEREPGRRFFWDYRNLPYVITIFHTNWNNHLLFDYDADRRRVTKVYDKGYVCDCGPEPLKASGGNDTLLQEQLEPNAPEEKDRQFQEPDTVLLDQAPPRRVEAPEGDSVTDIGTAKAAGPGGDCICRRKMTTNYIYSHDGRLLRVYEDGQLLRQYLYAGDQRIAVYEKQGLNFDLYYYLPDHLGSTRALVDNTGNVSSTFDYYPYGALKASSVNTDTKMRYTGKELDDEEIEQYYFGARYLNGATLRFNSIDPQGGRYPGWSPYCYALANPMKNVDRDGEQTFSYDFSKFLERREKLLGWAPGWVQETVMPVDPMIGPPVMAVGRFAEPIEVAAKTGARAAKPGIARLIAKARKFLQAAANKAERTVEGKGAKAGIAKHEVLKQEIEAHGKKLKLSSEVSYKGRDPVKYGKKGSVRVDVVLGSKKNPIATFDLKTGRATLTPQRMRILRAHLPKKTPIEQIKPTGLIE